MPNPERNLGRLLENAVFIALRRHEKKVYYYRSASGLEVDFFFRNTHLIQVCLTLEDPETEEREISALLAAGKELGIKRGYIVTHAEEKTLKIAGMTINVIPAWQVLTLRNDIF